MIDFCTNIQCYLDHFMFSLLSPSIVTRINNHLQIITAHFDYFCAGLLFFLWIILDCDIILTGDSFWIELILTVIFILIVI